MLVEDSDQRFVETGKSMKMDEKKSNAFYQDMRFWLVVLMLVAFLVFILIQYPG
jgi:hypothetical protein